jgi:hypothetical protein
MLKAQQRLQKAQPEEKLQGQATTPMTQQVEREALLMGPEDPPSIEPRAPGHSA